MLMDVVEKITSRQLGVIGWIACLWLVAPIPQGAEFRGSIVDADSGKPIAARVYLRNAAGEWLFVKSTAMNGSALPYLEQWIPMAGSVERHTTVSAHPFRIELPRGEYTLEIESGKEFIPQRRRLEIADEALDQSRRARLVLGRNARASENQRTAQCDAG